MAVDYTEVPMGTVDEAEHQVGFPSSFRKPESAVKTFCPWTRSYMFRRRLSVAAVASVFIFVGASISFVMMKRHDHVPIFGKLKYYD